MVGIEAQIGYLILWLAVIKVLQLAATPLIRPALGRFAAPLGYGIGILLFAVISWYAALIGLSPRVALPVLGAVLALAIWKQKGWSIGQLREGLCWDGVYLLFFLVMLGFRYTNPTITFAEKFMDHGFIAAIMQTPVVPPPDPWYAGGTLDVYYYLGHWTAAALGLATTTPSPVVFNLILPTIFGIIGVTAYAAGHLLLNRFRWLPLVPFLVPDPSFFLHLPSGFYTALWESTRTIQATITEYPIFSFVWGDPHSHVLGMGNQVVLLFLLAFGLLRWGRLDLRGRLCLCGCAALSLSFMPLANTWDVLVYAPVTVVVGLVIWHRHRQAADPWMPLVLVPAGAMAIALPGLLMLHGAGIDGVGLVHTPSDPVSFLLVHGLFIAVFLACCARRLARRPWLLVPSLVAIGFGWYALAIILAPLAAFIDRRRFLAADTLAICGLGVLCATELLYLQDNMGDLYYRMNTVFKLTLPAWIMTGIAASVMAGRWLEDRDLRIPPRAARPLTVAVAAMMLVFPVAASIDFQYSSRTLDGLAYLEESHPGDAAAVAFLRSLEGREVLVEAVGDDYTYASRVSSFTGIPTVMGWAGHEYVWRGPDAATGARTADVRRIYEEPEETLRLMERYNATLLYVGPFEEARYVVRLPDEGLTPVYENRWVSIYRPTG